MLSVLSREDYRIDVASGHITGQQEVRVKEKHDRPNGGGGHRLMKQKSRSPKQRKHPKTRLRLLDLEFSKAAVLNSLTSVDGQRGYGHVIDEFVDGYCSEPRLALNRTVVLRYRSELEARLLAREPSICDLVPFGASPMRQPTPVC
jgi:hypothetical protein